MSGYDPALKALVETVPADWLALLGVPPRPVEVIDANIATVSGAADKVLRVVGPSPWLLHLEFHAGHDGAEQPSKYLARNTLLLDRHQLPVRTLALILKRDADSPQLSGTYVKTLPETTEPYLTFHYEVRRVWQIDPEAILSGGAGMLPLAPIADVPEGQVSAIIKRMQARMSKLKVSKKTATTLWSATHILLGLRFPEAVARQLLQGVLVMRESTTYQAIIEEGRKEGRVEGLRSVLRRVGEAPLGHPSAAVVKALEAITDVSALEVLVCKAPNAESWESLLGLPTPRRRGKK